jgi:hypothetical protein
MILTASTLNDAQRYTMPSLNMARQQAADPMADMPRTTWWAHHNDNPERDDTTSRLHPSVIEFLKRVYHFHEDDFSFFHYLIGLRHPDDIDLGFKQDRENHDYDNRYYTLYCTDETHASKPDGLM